MKVIAQTVALQEALNIAGNIVTSRTPKPVLQCLKLTADEDTLTITATDLEVGCRYRLTAVKIEEPGEILIPAARLNGIVRESTDESLTIESEDKVCLVTGPGSKFRVFGYDPAEYPAVTEFPGEEDFQVSPQVLGEMIEKTIFATAKAHSHYAISGLLVEAEQKKLQFVATDGHRLSRTRGTLIEAAKKELSAIAPAKLMNMVQRLCGETEENVLFKMIDNQILVHTPSITLMSPTVQGNFPNYADVIPSETNRKVSLETEEFAHRIRQAALVTTEESSGVKFTFDKKTVTLSSRSPESGEAEIVCPAELNGDPMEICFNPAFMIDALRVVSSDSITVEMNAPNKPAVLKSGRNFLYVLMPVDLK